MSLWNNGAAGTTIKEETTIQDLHKQLIEIKIACQNIKQELKAKHDLMLAAREWRQLKIKQCYLRKQHRQIEEKYVSLKPKNK
jgi:hypothetical protein